jgi:CCR4-NOT transcription complex subunit 1
VALLRSGLISIAQEDQQLAKFLYSDPRPTLQTFAAGLVRECLSSDPPMASQSQFMYTLEILAQLSQANKANDE